MTTAPCDLLLETLAALTVPESDSDAHCRTVKQAGYALDAFSKRQWSLYGACIDKAWYESGDLPEGAIRVKVRLLLNEIEEAVHNDPRNTPDARGLRL